jgi:cell division protein FtsW (lipid II flippase)
MAGGMPLADVPYIAPLLWTVGASIAASIALHAVFGILSPRDAGKKDQRDREIYRFGEYIGQSFLVIGGVAALLMAMTETDYFWIANVIYLAFVLSAVLGSIAKIVAYRRGFQPW